MIDEPYSSESSGDRNRIPPLSTLFAFDAVVRLGSFAAAARELDRTPSAISHSLSDLERKTGVPLFVRVGRRVSPTQIALAYAADVREALDALKRGAKTLEQHSDTPVIRISAPPLFVATVLIPHMSDFESKYPGYRLSIETTNQVVSFADSEVDIGIRFASDTELQLQSVPLPEVRRIPVCAPGFASSQGIRTVQDLSRADLIQLAQAPGSWSDYLAQLGVEQRPDQRIITFDSTLSALEAARRGLGVTLAIFPLITAYPGFGSELIQVGPASTAMAAYRMVFRIVTAETRRIRLFTDWLQQTMLNMVNRYES